MNSTQMNPKLRVAQALITSMVLVSFTATNVFAQARPPAPGPGDFKMEVSCAADGAEPDDSVFFERLTYSVPETGERIQVELEARRHANGEASLIAHFISERGESIAFFEVTESTQLMTLGSGAAYLSDAARQSLGTVLQSQEFQRSLDNCAVAIKPWLKKFLKALCFAAAGVCCALTAVGCPICAAGAGACAAF